MATNFIGSELEDDDDNDEGRLFAKFFNFWTP